MTEDMVEPPPEPLFTHVYRTDVYTDNRNYEIQHRVTTHGVVPRGFVEFVAKVIIPMPQKHGIQIVHVPEAMLIPMHGLKDLHDGFMRFRELVEPGVKAKYEARCEHLKGSPIVQARGPLPKINLNG